MDFLSRLELAHVTGLERNKVVWSHAFHADAVGDPADPAFDIGNFWYQLLDVVQPGALVTLASLISPEISRAAGAAVVKTYEITGLLGGGAMGSPVAVSAFSIPAVGGGATAIPAEVAYVLTLEAVGRADAPVETADGLDAGAERDRPRQRHTGRFFTGPLTTHAIGMGADGVARPSAQIRDTLRLAYKGAAELAVTDGVVPCVWSRKDAILRPVTDISLDDSFDTMRSRGPAPTVRSRYDVVGG